MRKLHRQGEPERRHAEAFRRRHNIPKFSRKVILQSFVCNRVLVPRRRLEMHFDFNPVYALRQVHVVAGNRKDFPRLGIEFLVRFVPREEKGFHRDGIPRHHPEILQQGNDTFAPALDPDVDIAALPDKRVGVKPCVGSPLQDGRPSPLRLEQLREVRRLPVHHAVVPADCLRLARPLEGEVQRRLPVLRKLADARIGNAHHRLPRGKVVQKRPLFSGLYSKICTRIFIRI